ncbi:MULTISPECIES: ATP-binding cassette domain-containing protein [unclassified Streptomyces]|uniref:ATP-binding cassette domain-containing protein n=1 Tax=unclassified Streptomyces TaxID=2593676 RepID=UPI00136BBCDE|nr:MULTISPECIES: ATP-binding cassette domain-containing protein [unclassified Streptomyces]MYY82871.1 ATP-binding cassette domain-containing protein [Streptomyces sp. SID335]MYZ15270.1 ATP-binding cassette domain-containing protein [Streptomyces sp. SID337]NEB48158.1 ABC transporter ATP-binding protein [Streptomyces sp. SID339]
MERDLAVRLDGVGRRYGMGGPWVLRHVDLGIRTGSLVRVEGANGSGKSTLLRLLAGIDAPSEGRVSGRRRTAFVPERFPAALPFTALGYLTHMGRVHGLGAGAARRRASEWLELFGAGGYGRTPLSELSKGSSQKVAVAQALLAEPDLLVLDEAWTGLDAPARAALDRAVADRTAAGGAVAFVDHDPSRLRGMADETYAVVGTALNRRTAEGTSASGGARVRGGPVVLVEVQGPRGAELPEAVAESVVRLLPAAPDGTTRLTVPRPHSDRILRELLTARPPWHVVAVSATADAGSREAPGEGRGEEL